MEPENYRRQPARFGPRCESCVNYQEGAKKCEKYGCDVIFYMCCDSWRRNPRLPAKAV